MHGWTVIDIGSGEYRPIGAGQGQYLCNLEWVSSLHLRTIHGFATASSFQSLGHILVVWMTGFSFNVNQLYNKYENQSEFCNGLQ